MSNVTVQEALKAAIDFIESVHTGEWSGGDYSRAEILNIIEAALSEIDKCEPVGEMANDERTGHTYNILFYGNGVPIGTKLYTSPQPKEWVGLSDEVKQKLHKDHHLYIPTIELIESACKQLNTKG